MSSTVASDQYDNMIKKKLQITEDLADTKQSINYYKERKDALQNNPAGSDAKAENLDAQLEALSDKINELIDLTSRTSDDYYKNVTLRNAYNVLVPAASTVTNRIHHIIDNAKLPLIVIEALVIVAFIMLAIVEAIVADGRKRKGIVPEADKEPEKAPKADPEPSAK